MIGRMMGVIVGIDFASKFNESSCAFMVQRCSNKGGWYVVFREYGEGLWKGANEGP